MTTAALITHADGRVFLREGECDGCQRPGVKAANCCTFMVLPLARSWSADEASWAALHGVKVEGATATLQIACSALSEDGRCGLFGKPERPAMCNRYPEMPEQLLEGCAFHFHVASRR